jgi:hypothetical protein
LVPQAEEAKLDRAEQNAQQSSLMYEKKGCKIFRESCSRKEILSRTALDKSVILQTRKTVMPLI